jgi:tetratricopeptide (TPR) repeat protein
VHFNRGEHEVAVDFFSRAVDAHEQVGNRSMQAEDYNDMGAAFRYLGRKELALDRFEKAIEMHVQLDNRRLESITRSNRAGVLSDLGRYDEALAEATRAKTISVEVGDPVPMIWARCWEGTAFEGLGRYDEAEASFVSALEQCRQIDNPRGLAGVLGMYGSLLLRYDERHDAAAVFVSEAIGLMKRFGLKQAFGGRTIEQMIELRSKLS